MTSPTTAVAAAVMDAGRAYHFGTFVATAYAMFAPADLTPTVPPTFPPGYRLALYLTAVDHACGKTEPEFFGFVAQATAQPGELVVVLRGTDTTLEWLVDAEFRPVPFTRVPGSGDVEHGFCSVYDSLAALTPDGQPADLHAFLQGASRAGPVTIVGHSLGASVATLLALDAAVNDGIRDVTLYTLASPRTGDAAFAACFDAHVSASWRVVNAPDIVPKLPPLYTHVSGEYGVDSRTSPVRHSLVCYHRASTYLYLLDPQHQPSLGGCQG
jgi:hypothetical protein